VVDNNHHVSAPDPISEPLVPDVELSQEQLALLVKHKNTQIDNLLATNSELKEVVKAKDLLLKNQGIYIRNLGTALCNSSKKATLFENEARDRARVIERLTDKNPTNRSLEDDLVSLRKENHELRMRLERQLENIRALRDSSWIQPISPENGFGEAVKDAMRDIYLDTAFISNQMGGFCPIPLLAGHAELEVLMRRILGLQLMDTCSLEAMSSLTRLDVCEVFQALVAAAVVEWVLESDEFPAIETTPVLEEYRAYFASRG